MLPLACCHDCAAHGHAAVGVAEGGCFLQPHTWHSWSNVESKRFSMLVTC